MNAIIYLLALLIVSCSADVEPYEVDSMHPASTQAVEASFSKVSIVDDFGLDVSTTPEKVIESPADMHHMHHSPAMPEMNHDHSAMNHGDM